MRNWLYTVVGILTSLGFVVVFFYALASVIEIPEKLIRWGVFKHHIRRTINKLLHEITQEPPAPPKPPETPGWPRNRNRT